MRTFLLFSILIISISNIYAQIFPNECEKAGVFLPSMPPCNNGSYFLVFEDNFDGTSIDLTKWNPVTGVNRDFTFSQVKAWHLPSNLEVSNGTLKITAKKLENEYIGTWETDWSTTPPTTQTSNFNFTTGELWSKSEFFYGKYEIRCRLPNGNGFFPAFWMYGGQRWNEIDVFDNIQGNNGFYCGPGYDFDGDGDAEGCRWSTNNVPDFSEWQTFTCIFDFDRIEWKIDGSTVRILHRYSTVAGTPILCGEDIASGVYFQEQSFPIENMHIVMNLAIKSGDDGPDENTIFPSYYEVDWVKFFVKSEEPPCNDCFDYFIFENTEQLPILTRAHNYIKAGNNVIVKNGQFVTLLAPTTELLPGFSTELGANFEIKSENCNLLNYVDVPISLIGNNLNNESEIIKCINPIYTIEATSVQNYTFEVNNMLGQMVFNTSGTPTANQINIWNTSDIAEGWYNANLNLQNCSDSETRNYNLLISYGTCKTEPSSFDTIQYENETNTIGLGENSISRKEFLIYPNPVNQKLNIFYSATNSSTITLVITEIYGKEVFRKENSVKIGSNILIIDINQFPTGPYILKIISKDKLIESKFIISK